MKHFILIAPGMTEAQELEFRGSLRSNIGWWHQLANTWLLIDPDGLYTASSITGLVKGISEYLECAAFEVQPGIWATRLRQEKLEPNASWMDKNWTMPPRHGSS